jgi:hypothetical protein
MGTVRRVFTEEEFKQMFSWRAAGATYAAIGEKLECADNTARLAMLKVRAGSYGIPQDVFDKAALSMKRSKKTYIKKKKNGVCAATSMGEYTAKCQELVEAEDVALQFFPQDTLDLIRLSIRENSNRS